MFLAAGFWKTFATSFVLGSLFVCLSLNLGRGNVMQASLQGAWLAALFGFVILIVSSALAVGSALLSRTQVWASRDVHRARRADAWPPSHFVRPEAMNQVDVLMMPMLLVLCLGLVAAVTLLAITATSKLAKDGEGIIAITSILSMIVGSGLILWLRDAITLRMVAGSACACWPLEEEASYEYEDPFGMPR